MRLLLVVDGGLVRSTYGAVLSARSLPFDAASSLADGLARVRRHAYDVIVAEDTVAGMSGLAFLKAVRAIDDSVPIVLMTNGPPLESALPASEHGLCRYVSKSAEIDVLEETLRRAERCPAPGVVRTGS
jgi:DNA-binding NtrC family response regulator